MELTIIETSAYLEMRKQFSLLAVQLEDFRPYSLFKHRREILLSGNGYSGDIE